MATPTSVSYAAASGVTIYGGRAAPNSYPNALLDLVAAVPEASWVSVSANTFDSIWPASDYLAAFGAGVSSPASTIRCWSSFAWDDTNYRLIIWGGGHANSADNSVYMWSASNRQWSVAFMPSDVVNVTGGMGQEPIDGPLNAPQSSHTYCNQVWLPVLQRFMTFGGAAQASGGVFQCRTPALRTLGAYTLNLAQAGQNKVGGTTGSNVHRNTTIGVDLVGAQAWGVRDWFLDWTDSSGVLAKFGARTNGICDVRIENGHDTVYFKGGAGNLLRIEMVDQDYHHDIITCVGLAWTSAGQANSGALDPVGNVFMTLRDSTYPMEGFNLNTAGPGNQNFLVPAAGIGGSAAAAFTTAMGAAVNGMFFDKKRDCFIVWGGGGTVYKLQRPSNMADPTTGWTVSKLSDDSASPRPITYAEMGDSTGNGDTGVSGKWKRSESLDVYIGLQGSISGNIWIFKPVGWNDPRG